MPVAAGRNEGDSACQVQGISKLKGSYHGKHLLMHRTYLYLAHPNVDGAPPAFRALGALPPGCRSLTCSRLTCSLWALSRAPPPDWLRQREKPHHIPFDLIPDWAGAMRARVRSSRTKMPSGRAGGGDVESGGRRDPPLALGTFYLRACRSRHKSATEPWLWWLRRRRRRRRQRRRQLWGLRLGVCRPPLLLRLGMYKWLTRLLGTIFRFCDRSVPPARALLKRRRSNR